jgi:pyrroline-5-carboxylate reductase
MSDQRRERLHFTLSRLLVVFKQLSQGLPADSPAQIRQRITDNIACTEAALRRLETGEAIETIFEPVEEAST